MKRYCLAAVAMLFAFRMFADSYLSPMVNIHYSGFSQYNAASRNVHYDPRLGVKIGLATDSALWDVILVQTGLFLTMQGGTHEEHEGNNSLKENIRLNYLEMPLNYGYRLRNNRGGNYFIVTGPFARLGLWGKYESRTIINGQEQYYKTSNMFGYREDALYRMFDFGWNFSVGFMLPSCLYARIDYAVSLENIAKAASTKAKNVNGFGISIGYTIDKDRRRGY